MLITRANQSIDLPPSRAKRSPRYWVVAAALAAGHCTPEVDDGGGNGGEGAGQAASSSSSMCGATVVSRSPTVVVDDPSVGTREWDNPGAFLDGGETQILNMMSDDVSHLLLGREFLFNIPAAAVIQGIEVAWTRRALLDAGLQDDTVRLIKGGVLGIADRSKPETWSAEETVVYGAPTDLWGDNWTAANINGGFGVGLSVVNAGDSVDTAMVSDLVVTIYFTVAC